MLMHKEGKDTQPLQQLLWQQGDDDVSLTRERETRDRPSHHMTSSLLNLVKAVQYLRSTLLFRAPAFAQKASGQSCAAPCAKHTLLCSLLCNILEALNNEGEPVSYAVVVTPRLSLSAPRQGHHPHFYPDFSTLRFVSAKPLSCMLQIAGCTIVTVAASVLLSSVAVQASNYTDVDILNFALNLEVRRSATCCWLLCTCVSDRLQA